MKTDGPILAWFIKLIYVLHKLRLPMWFSLAFMCFITTWWTYWLLEKGNFILLTDWQLAVVSTVYLALIPIFKLAVEHSERGITKDPE